MSSEKTDAIVLRVVEFSETSCVVTLFSRDFGKISALAKGARRAKSPFEAALDLLAVCRIVFLRRSSEGLDLLTEAKLERRFKSAAREIARLYAGIYVIELLRDLTDNHDPHPELFEAAVTALASIDSGENIAAHVLRFEVMLLRELGQLPSLDTCVGCGQEFEIVGRVAFGLESGGVLCAKCRPSRRQVLSVSAGAIKSLQRYAETDSEVWRRLDVDQRTSGELRGVLNLYIAHVVGHRPRMHQFSQMRTN